MNHTVSGVQAPQEMSPAELYQNKTPHAGYFSSLSVPHRKTNKSPLTSEDDLRIVNRGVAHNNLYIQSGFLLSYKCRVRPLLHFNIVGLVCRLWQCPSYHLAVKTKAPGWYRLNYSPLIFSSYLIEWSLRVIIDDVVMWSSTRFNSWSHLVQPVYAPPWSNFSLMLLHAIVMQMKPII